MKSHHPIVRAILCMLCIACASVTICAQTRFTAREGLVAYAGTLNAEDERTLRAISLQADSVSWEGAKAWRVNALTVSSQVELVVTHSGDTWHFDTISHVATARYDTARTIDPYSWIDSDSLLKITLRSTDGTPMVNEGMPIGSLFIRTLVLDAYTSHEKSAVWKVGFGVGLYYDSLSGSHTWSGGELLIDAHTGECLWWAVATHAEEDTPYAEEGEHWKITPNPSSETMRIGGMHAVQQGRTVQAEILTMAGNVVRTILLESGSTSIDVHSLPSGMYLLRCGTGSTMFAVLH